MKKPFLRLLLKKKQFRKISTTAQHRDTINDFINEMSRKKKKET